MVGRNLSVRAFTLIELLVVISIIALMISILLPALSKARESGRAIQCLSNQRQVGIATFNYLGDSKGMYPQSYFRDTDQATFGRYWNSHLYVLKYFSTAKTLICPTYATPDTDGFLVYDSWANVNGTETWWAYPHFGINLNHIGSGRNPDAGNTWAPAHESDLKSPTSTIPYLDSVGGRTPTRAYYAVYDTETAAMSFGSAHARHGSAVNTTWADGHASAIGVTDPRFPYSTGLTQRQDSPNYWDRK